MGEFTLSIQEIKENNIDLFDYTYPFYDETKRAEFERKITEHFYFREIGVETVGRFIFNLRVRLNEIMPYFNKMYVTESLVLRILDNYDVEETYTGSTGQDGTDGSTGTDKQLHSDTPQGRVDISSGEFVSDIQDVASTNTGTNHAEGTNDWTRSMKGNIGVQTDADAVANYRNALLNVDLEVFKALGDLFMQVYC